MFLAKVGNKESCSESPSLLSTVAEVAFVAGNERKLSLRVRSAVRLFWGGQWCYPMVSGDQMQSNLPSPLMGFLQCPTEAAMFRLHPRPGWKEGFCIHLFPSSCKEVKHKGQMGEES